MKIPVLWVLLLLGSIPACTCVDLTQGRPYQCSYVGNDAGANLDQCATGWRCGLENRCHPIGVASNYQCTSDQSCESGWRCSPNGQCINPFADALRPNAGAGTPVLSKLSPQNFEGIRQLAVSEDYATQDPCTDNGQPAFSYSATLSDGGLIKVIHYPLGRSQLPDGGSNGNCNPGSIPYVLTDVMSAAAPPGVVATLELGTESTLELLNTNGGVCTSTFVRPNEFQQVCTPGKLGFTATQLRNVNDFNALQSAYLAFSATDYSYNDPYQSSGVLSYPASGITDLDYLTQGYPSGVLIAATSSGAFVSSWDGRNPLTGAYAPGWYAAGFCTPSIQPTHFRHFYPSTQGYDGGLALSVEESITGLTNPTQEVLVTTAEEQTFEILPACPPIPQTESGLMNSWFTFSPFNFSLSSTFQPTANHADILDINIAPNLPRYAGFPNGPFAAEVHSTGSNTDDLYESFETIGAGYGYSVPSSPRFTRPKVFQNTNPDRFAEADDLGHVWISRDNTLEPMSMMLDRPPVAVAGSLASTLVIGTPPELVTAAPAPYEISPAQLYQWVPGLGLSALQGNRNDYSFALASAIIGGSGPRVLLQMEAASQANGESVILFSGADQDSPFQLGLAALTTNPVSFRLLATGPGDLPLPGPYHQAVTTNSQGRTVALVTANDRLLAVDITDALANADAGSFSSTQICNGTCPGFIPLVQAFPRLQGETSIGGGNPIDSITTVEPAADAGTGPYVDGYVLSSGALYHVAAPTQFSWALEPVSLPVGSQADPLKAYKVFNDGTRGRVAFNDGSVYSLPSVVQIAPPLPGVNGAPVGSSQDVVQLCQNTFSLGTDGLYSLQANTGSPIGTWSRIPIDNSLLPGGSNNWTGGKLFATGGDLLVFHPLGWVLRVTGYTCN